MVQEKSSLFLETLLNVPPEHIKVNIMIKNLYRKVKAHVSKKASQVKLATVGFIVLASGNANAALVQADVDSIVTAVLADLAMAVAAGFALLTVAAAAKAGFGLVSSFISRGARG